MIFVQPAYLPSVNYFRDFNDNDLVYNINLGLDESYYFDETYISNENGVFKVKVPNFAIFTFLCSTIFVKIRSNTSSNKFSTIFFEKPICI